MFPCYNSAWISDAIFMRSWIIENRCRPRTRTDNGSSKETGLLFFILPLLGLGFWGRSSRAVKGTVRLVEWPRGRGVLPHSWQRKREIPFSVAQHCSSTPTKGSSRTNTEPNRTKKTCPHPHSRGLLLAWRNTANAAINIGVRSSCSLATCSALWQRGHPVRRTRSGSVRKTRKSLKTKTH